MPLIVLHAADNQHEADLDTDAARMGNHYDGPATHVLGRDNQDYSGPQPNVTPIVHLLSHGSGGAQSGGSGPPRVADMKDTTFLPWMVKTFHMKAHRNEKQTFFIYACDIATGNNNLLKRLAEYVASEDIANRTFVGTAGENAVIAEGDTKGKVVVLDSKAAQLPLGTGWKAYETVRTGSASTNTKGSKKDKKDKSAKDEPTVIAREVGGAQTKSKVMAAMTWS
jgi:hypothetical protein